MGLEQKVNYFEPNSLEFNNEDLNIGLYFEVEVLERGLVDGGVYTGEVTITNQHVDLFKGKDGLLTTSYTDITMLELSNGGNTESIGIESINIKYNSWYFPEINIKFVDVRGNAVFNPMEMTNNIDKNGNPEGKGSFLECLFMFPYPIFKLTVKGYYGRPVTYRLTVKDMRSSFNSQTGNFEISVNFIGYMYSYLTDVPMSILFAAPFIEYSGCDSELGVFTYGNEKGQRIPNFVDFVQQVTAALKSMENNEEITNSKKQIEKDSSSKLYLDNILNVYNSLENDIVTFFDVAGNNGKIIINFNQNKFDENRGRYTNCRDLASKLAHNITEIQDNWQHLVDMHKALESKPLQICKQVKIVDISNYREDKALLKYNSQYEFNSNIELTYDYVNDKEICEKLKIEFERNIENVTKNIENLRKEILGNSFNWQPTIRNIFEMVLKHMDKFYTNMSYCIDNINSHSSERNLSKINYKTDCNTHSDNITVYPFPAFYDDKNNYTWIGQVPAAMNYDERKFVEHIIEGTNLASTKLKTALEDYTAVSEAVNFFPTNGIPVLYYDLEYGNDYKKHGDFLSLVNSKDDKTLPEAFKILAYRFILWHLYNSNIDIDEKTFAEIEALNMLGSGYNVDAFKNTSLWYNDKSNRYFEEFENLINSCLDSMAKFSNKSDAWPITYEDCISSNSVNREIWLVPYDYDYIDETHRYEYFKNTLKDYTQTYDSRMNGVSSTLIAEGINVEKYHDYFPSTLSNVSLLKESNSFLTSKKSVTTFLDLTEFNYVNNDEQDLITLANTIETYGKRLSIIDGNYDLEDLTWINKITDFYPTFKYEKDDIFHDNTKDSFDSLVEKKETKWAKWWRTNADSNVHYSFSCRRYWSKDESKNNITENVKKRILSDFFEVLGFNILTIKYDILSKIERQGIFKLPKIEVMFLGHYAATESSIDSNCSNNPIFKKAKDIYDKNFDSYVTRIVDYFLTDKDADENYNDLLVFTEGNKKNQYFVRDASKNLFHNYLTEILSEYVYFFNLHGTPTVGIQAYDSEDKHAIKSIGSFKVLYNANNSELKQKGRNVINYFIEKVRNKCGLIENNSQVINNIENTAVSDDRKLGIYDMLKNLYDRWKFGAYRKNGSGTYSNDTQVTIDNFIFRNVLNKDIGDDLNINLDKLVNLINSIFKGGNEMSVYNFLFEVCSYADCLMMSLPINVFNAINTTEKLKDMFTPFNYISAKNDALQTTFIVTYRQKDSQHLSYNPNSSSYKDDGIDFHNYVAVANNDNSENMGVFGVTYSLGTQRFFKNVQVSMDKPKMTEQSISSMLYIAEQGDKNGSNKIGRAYHDLFDTYSNHSYSCTVEMMGNAQIMPMMYFQLNNIPLFKGGYLIVSAEHTINSNGMTSTFTGNRINKYQFNLTNSDIWESGTAVDGSQGEDDSKGIVYGNKSKKVVSLGNEEKLTYNKEKTLIILDAGHNMKTKGKQSPEVGELVPDDSPEREGNGVLTANNSDGTPSDNYREYWGCRKIADGLYDKLINRGYNVKKLYNTGQDANDYSKFTTEANRLYNEQKEKGGSTIIISIHSNAAANSGWGGGNRWEIYKQSAEYVESENTIYKAKHPRTSGILAECIAKETSKVFKSLENKNNYPNIDGVKMSVHLTPKTFENRKTTKGIRPTTYCLAPTVLSENLFHDTKTHVEFLSTKEGRDAIINSHFNGIEEFFRQMNS